MDTLILLCIHYSSVMLQVIQTAETMAATFLHSHHRRVNSLTCNLAMAALAQ
jgi:hypothetical protein